MNVPFYNLHLCYMNYFYQKGNIENEKAIAMIWKNHIFVILKIKSYNFATIR